MIDDLKPYPETKDSGLAWLGDIPAHWKIKRNGSLFQQRNAVGEPDWPILEVSLRTGVRIRELGSTKRKQVMSDKAKYKCATKGDFVYNMMRMWQGAAGIAPVDGLVSPAYVVAKPLPHTNPAYFASLFRTDDYLAEIDAFSRGIVKDRNRLYWDQFKQIPTPCPPPEEQAAIARFLAWATNRLDRAIGAKRRIIALLQEQKQAIIHRAVTRGLDPSVPLKDSGIPWLGEIPEHWEVVRLKSLVSHVTSGSRGWSNFAADSGVLFIRIGNLTRASLDLDFNSSVRLQLPRDVHSEATRSRVQPDDILLSITAFIGSVAVVSPGMEEAYVSQHVACCRPRVGAANSSWIGYVLLSNVGQTHGKLSMYGGTKQGLSLDDVRNHLVLLPPRSEQDDLAEWIGHSTTALNAGISNAKHEITLLHEYRTRLIADVVTGKLDVRGMAKELPKEELQDQPEVEAVYDAEDSEDDAEFDLIDPAET